MSGEDQHQQKKTVFQVQICYKASKQARMAVIVSGVRRNRNQPCTIVIRLADKKEKEEEKMNVNNHSLQR